MNELDKVQEFKREIDSLRNRKIKTEGEMEALKKNYSELKVELTKFGVESKEDLDKEVQNLEKSKRELEQSIADKLKKAKELLSV